MSNIPDGQECWNPYVEDVPSKVCPACHGTCFEDEYESVECDRCDGEGVIHQIRFVPVEELADRTYI